MLTVVSEKRNKQEANISFGFDPKDPMRGPFLDPLNKQGPYADEFLMLVKNLLMNDVEYVKRLKRHYRIAKEIASGKLDPRDAAPSPRITGVVDLESHLGKSFDDERDAGGSAQESSLQNQSGLDGNAEFPPTELAIAKSVGFDPVTPEGRAEFIQLLLNNLASHNLRVIPPISGSISRRPEREAKKRQRQAKKRNRR